ncbi:MAG: hypothetical protein F6K65_38350 [Moorea sp. SIO3C2]|nr:hypothetical protein [Moorena sp. SIO3C2]
MLATVFQEQTLDAYMSVKTVRSLFEEAIALPFYTFNQSATAIRLCKVSFG